MRERFGVAFLYKPKNLFYFIILKLNVPYENPQYFSLLPIYIFELHPFNRSNVFIPLL